MCWEVSSDWEKGRWKKKGKGAGSREMAMVGWQDRKQNDCISLNRLKKLSQLSRRGHPVPLECKKTFQHVSIFLEQNAMYINHLLPS